MLETNRIEYKAQITKDVSLSISIRLINYNVKFFAQIT
jgi:hypothetical protein